MQGATQLWRTKKQLTGGVEKRNHNEEVDYDSIVRYLQYEEAENLALITYDN